MKIVIVSQYFPPELALIPSALAEELVTRGHQVRVLTSFPNYPFGTLFSGYKQRMNYSENYAGAVVRRVPMYINHSRNPAARMLSYLSFAISTTCAGRFAKGADVVYVYATQMTPAIGPSIWSVLRRQPFVLHVQDLWPESITGSTLITSGLGKRIINSALGPWLRFLYRRAAATIAIAPAMARMLESRGVPGDRLHHVFNWADEHSASRESLAGVDRLIESGTEEQVAFVYAGNLGDMQDLETVVRAAGLVRDLEGFHLYLVGAGVAENSLRTLTKELGGSNVSFVGRVDPSKIHEVYAASDYQIISLKKLAIFEGTIPSKLQTSLAHGVPVIVTVPGDVSELVVANEIGFVAPPEDSRELGMAFRAAYALTRQERVSMGERAVAFYRQVMSADKGIDAIEKILIAAAAKSPTREKCPR